MSKHQVDEIVNSADSGPVDFPQGLTAGGVDVKSVPNGEVKVLVAGGGTHGSTNTRIRRFPTVEISTGSSITYADSAAAGTSFTINEDGIYSLTYGDLNNSAVSQMGVSLNSSQLSTNVANITDADRILYTETPGANNVSTISVTRRLSAGDVLRAHTDGNMTSTNPVVGHFTITPSFSRKNIPFSPSRPNFIGFPCSSSKILSYRISLSVAY